MNKIQKGLVGIALIGVISVSGCKSYFSDVLRGALKSQEVPISLIDTECEPIIKNRAYLMLQECKYMNDKEKGKAIYRNKMEHALCSLQDIDDPNAFQLSVDYYNAYPESGINILERAYEKKQNFRSKNKK